MTLGIELVLVAAAGGAAVWHAQSETRRIKALTGAAGGILAVVVAFLGVLLATGS